ncbi:MAG: EAL domain-containing protein [Pseudomonadota bacterium]
MASNSAGHNCHCRSTARRVAILLGGVEEKLPDFESIVQRFGGIYHKPLSVLELPIGAGCKFLSVGKLRDFLMTQWSGDAPGMRCCWLDPDRSVQGQLAELVAAAPLLEWARERDTPLQAILEHRRIQTWYQPVFAGDTLEIWGYECLVRATAEDGQIIPPDKLFRWAKDENLVFMLDRLCRERHIENCARLQLDFKATFLINFLPTVIYDPAVCLATTFAIARRENLDPSQVVFEVVESELVSDREHLRNIMDEYRASGFRVALDDVGAGHAGLSLLGDLAPDLIKIDRGLVCKAVDSKLHRTICKSIVEIARAADKLVLAEGVETDTEYQLFRDLGVDLYQGYLFGKPQPVPANRSLFAPPAANSDAAIVG